MPSLADSPDISILRRLRSAGAAFTPASEFAVGADVGVRMSELSAAGYEIEQHPYLGYRLISAPDRLIADDILSRLPTCQWIRNVTVFERTASTNDVVAGMARDGADAGAVVFAEEQTAGRGRLGRRWQSDPRQGLWFSLLLRPRIPASEWTRLTLWAAYAVAAGIGQYAAEFGAEFAAAEVMLKWPNDLYISGRKVAGILIESSLGDNAFAVAGIGLNVNQTAFPSPLKSSATSLRMAMGVRVDRNALAAALLASIDQSFHLVASDFQTILKWASTVDYLRGRSVSATAGSASYTGIAQGLDSDAGLLIRTTGGEVIRLTSGEVTQFSSGGG